MQTTTLTASTLVGETSSNFLVDPLGERGPRDFRPKAGSPLVDAGVVIDGITDGWEGEAPDLGAYEFGGQHWTPGVSWDIASRNVTAFVPPEVLLNKSGDKPAIGIDAGTDDEEAESRAESTGGDGIGSTAAEDEVGTGNNSGSSAAEGEVDADESSGVAGFSGRMRAGARVAALAALVVSVPLLR